LITKNVEVLTLFRAFNALNTSPKQCDEIIPCTMLMQLHLPMVLRAYSCSLNLKGSYEMKKTNGLVDLINE
jgi:hypothetical protein